MAQARQPDRLSTGATIEIDGVQLRVREAGSGRPLVVLGDDGQIDALRNGLAKHNRVLAIEVSGGEGLDARKLAEAAAAALARMKLEQFSVIGISRGAALALTLAVFAPHQIDKLILMSPPPMAALDEEVRAGLAQVAAPTLVMVGSRDRSGGAETMRALREKIAACHLLLVYDAGEAIAAERPDACLTPIGEFLERGIEFVVCHESQVIRR